MSDIKHLEYCAKLGNVMIKNRLEEYNQENYEQNQRNYIYDNNSFQKQGYNNAPEKRNEEALSFKARLQNW